MIKINCLLIVRIENENNNPYPGLQLPVDYNFELNDIDIDEEDNDWDPINREFGSDFTITSLPNGQGYDVVDVNRDELAYKQQVSLTGYCTAENDANNNLWVTMESPFLTKKIKQKFPQLPGYVIPENRLRATGDTEIEITTNGTYILGQNDEDPDDLEMDEEIPTNSNQQRSLTLSKMGTRDTISTFTLGKFNVNVPSPTINSPITSNGYYKFDGNTLISGTNQDYNINVNVNSNPIINIKSIKNLSSSTIIPLTNFTKITTSTLRVSIPPKSTMIGFIEYSTNFRIIITANTNSFTSDVDRPINTYYYILNNNNNILLLNENNETILEIQGNNDSSQYYLYKTIFNLIFD